MRDEAPQARGARTWRAAGSDTGAHRRLHHEERRRDGGDADQQRGPGRRMPQPLRSEEHKQQRGECHADQVMGDPSDRMLATHGRNGLDRCMAKTSARHLREPAPDQTIVRQCDAEQLPSPSDNAITVTKPSLMYSDYHRDEMTAYHQSACIVQYLLEHFGVEKFGTLWQEGSTSFEQVYGMGFPELVARIDADVAAAYPNGVELDWERFKKGCK